MSENLGPVNMVGRVARRPGRNPIPQHHDNDRNQIWGVKSRDPLQHEFEKRPEAITRAEHRQRDDETRDHEKDLNSQPAVLAAGAIVPELLRKLGIGEMEPANRQSRNATQGVQCRKMSPFRRRGRSRSGRRDFLRRFLYLRAHGLDRLHLLQSRAIPSRTSSTPAHSSVNAY